MRSTHFSLLIIALFLVSCADKGSKKFELLGSNETGVTFNNVLTENDSLNYFTYAYMYMGGGVSVGDLNGDDLPDLYFTGNMVPNKLYLNKGNLQFEDVTNSAGVAGDSRWYTGSTMVDINNDGHLDIYLSVSGKFEPHTNQLFINNGDMTFTESAGEYGLADDGEIVQTSFFDYDKDGDLDAFMAHYPSTSFKTPNTAYRYFLDKKDLSKSDRLLQRQDDGTFKDVSAEAGIANFGLAISAAIADYNNDGYDDIYVSNDFSTPDFFYINNGDGTFTDKLQDAVNQTSFYGMGTDAADVNNDGLIDFLQVDMAAQDNRRQKANMASMNPELFWSTVNSGFHYQYMYNTFQLNRGIVDGTPIFSNIAFGTGVAATDWSWCPLFADFDNDGQKDLFISNGTRKEINNRDFFKKVEKLSGQEQVDSSLALSNGIPEEPIDNFVFRNTGNASFAQANSDWGLEYVGFSNGAAYADLDLDGDLDLIINNIDSEAAIFRNNGEPASNYLKVKLADKDKNINGLGARVVLHSGDEQQTQVVATSRGYQSSIEPLVHFGLGASQKMDKIEIEWTDGTYQSLSDITANQLLTIEKSGSDRPRMEEIPTLFTNAQQGIDPIFTHQEDYYNDFYHQVLLPHKMSNFGPALAAGDLNGDGLEDIFVGNGTNAPAKVFLQNSSGGYSYVPTSIENDSIYEDMGAVIFDADGDGDNDLYVASGGNTFPEGAWEYEDRLYININGTLTRSMESLPSVSASAGRAFPIDFDDDGDLDILVAGRLMPHQYPDPGKTILWENTSTSADVVQFKQVTNEVIPEIENLGMITDIAQADIDGDGIDELLATGEWMGISTFKWTGSQYERTASDLDNSQGWWFSLKTADVDNDGDLDVIAGNLGTNYKYQATENATFDLYVDDFDRNESKDLVLGYFNNGEQFPVRGRQCSSEQIPTIQLKFKDYNSFASASLEDIYGKKGLEDALHLQIKSFSSKVFLNDGKGKFSIVELPAEAQYAPINDMIVRDIDEDGNIDIIAAGNLFAAEVETPRADAGVGLVMKGNGDGTFRVMPMGKTGLVLRQDVKELEMINNTLFAASNQGELEAFELRSE